MSKCLVAFDTDRIKEYVFATGILKEIRGASSLLDTLNRREMPKYVKGTCWYAHGGGGLFLVENEHVAKDSITQVQQLYRERTGGAATITGTYLKLPDGFDEQQGDIQALQVWKQLSQKLAFAKASNPTYHTAVTHPLLRFGDTDGTFYATEPHPNEPGSLISRVSAIKFKYASQPGGKSRPEDFAAIAAVSAPQNYFALVVADGDNMGKVLETCTTLPRMKRAAESIYAILSKSIDEAVDRLDLPSHHYDVLLQGGDDLVLAVPAQTALPLSMIIAEEFSRRCRQELKQDLTLSTAIVWAHTAFPFGAWQEIAHSALAFTKRQRTLDRLRREQQELPELPLEPLINFLVISSANHLDFEQWYTETLMRDKAEDGYRIVRTLRPYTLNRLERLLRYRRTIQGISRSKLEALRRAVFQPSQQQAMLDALRVLAHWRDETTRQTILKFVYELVDSYHGPQSHPIMFPFQLTNEPDEFDPEEIIKVYRTPLVDLAELWDFISTPGGAGGADADE